MLPGHSGALSTLLDTRQDTTTNVAEICLSDLLNQNGCWAETAEIKPWGGSHLKNKPTQLSSES